MICCLAVSADCRRQGIGSLLLAYALEKLGRTHVITVSTFRAEDEKGIAPRALYQKYGFIADERIEEFGYPNQRFVLYPNCKAIDIYGDNYLGITNHSREASRGIIVKNENIVLSHETFLIVNECYGDWKFVSYYFECTVAGVTEQKPTNREMQVGAVPEWVAITDAMGIFSHYQEYAESNEERRGIYLREYKALAEFLK